MRERWLCLLPVFLLTIMASNPGQCNPHRNTGAFRIVGESETSRERTVPNEDSRLSVPSGAEEPATEDQFEEDAFDLREELEFIKRRLLSELGLRRVPDPRRANVSESEMQKMLDLYRRSVERQEEEEESAGSSLESPGASGVHRIYTYKDSASEMTGNKVKTKNCDQWLFFQVGDTGRHKRVRSLRSAKLHLRNPCRCGQKTVGTDQARVAIYQITERWKGVHRETEDEGGRLLIEERLLNSVDYRQEDRWTVFDISKSAAVWLERPSVNHGLLVKCYGVRNSKRLIVESGDDPAVLDLIVRERQLPNASARSKRSRSNGRHLSNSSARNETQLGRRLGNRRLGGKRTRIECTATNKTSQCCRYNLTVSFKEIGYEWVIQPATFEAYFCRGHCTARSKNYASTHAMIQSFLNHKGKRSNHMHVPRPCCAPSTLLPLKVLHYNNNVEKPEVVMTEMQNMIVKDCACS